MVFMALSSSRAFRLNGENNFLCEALDQDFRLFLWKLSFLNFLKQIFYRPSLNKAATKINPDVEVIKKKTFRLFRRDLFVSWNNFAKILLLIFPAWREMRWVMKSKSKFFCPESNLGPSLEGFIKGFWFFSTFYIKAIRLANKTFFELR